MAIAIPNEMPPEITANTTVKYRRSYSNFPASQGWALTLKLVGKYTLSATAAADGDAFLFTLTPAMTDDLLGGGLYQWEERAAKSGEVYVAAAGVVTVRPDVTTAAQGQYQAFVERALELVEARIAGRLADGADVESFQIGDRTINQIPFDELRKVRAWLLGELRSMKSGGSFSRQVLVSFPGTGL